MAAVAVLQAENPNLEILLHRVPFFLEPGYISKPDSFTESHDERMIRKFGSKEAFERVKKAHALIERGRDVGLTAEVGFTQAQLDKRVQSCTLDSHRLVLFVEQQFGTALSEAL
jgi:hypothetical protein